MKIRFIIYSFFLTLALAGILETASRIGFIQNLLPMSSRGINHHFLDMNFALSQRLAHEQGGIDAVMIGTSQVMVSFDPEVFSRRYNEITERKMTAYNFGVAGLTLPAKIALINILWDEYHPEWLLIGLSVPMLSEKIRPSQERILSSPWIRYRNQDFNFPGWLTEHSRFFQYFLRFRQWLQYPDFSARISRKESRVSPYGFSNFKNPSSTRSLVLDPKRIQRFRDNLKDYSISRERVKDLDRLLSFRDKTNLIVIEMPVHPYFNTLYKNGEQDHKRTVKIIRDRCAQYRVPFVPADNPAFECDRLWIQTNHMNALGAEMFSSWLSEKFAETVQ